MLWLSTKCLSLLSEQFYIYLNENQIQDLIVWVSVAFWLFIKFIISAVISCLTYKIIIFEILT